MMMDDKEFDEDELIMLPGGPPPRTPAPPRPVRINFTESEVEERLRKRSARIVRTGHDSPIQPR